jgi:hypothetical protein
MLLTDADQAFQAATGTLEGRALLGRGRGGAGDPFAFGGLLGLAPAVAGPSGPCLL